MASADETQVDVDSEVEGEDSEFRMSLSVDIEDIGPCKKHVKVTVPRADVDHFYGEAVGEMISTANVPGFRAGKVPQRLVERRFKDELAGQVKQRVLVESLEQLAEDNELDPINEPDLDVETLDLPDDGDFEYEFDVEVRPSFELPAYDGLKIDRPTREISDEDVEAYQNRFISQYGELEDVDGVAEAGDTIVATATFTHGGEEVRDLPGMNFEVLPVLRFEDAELEGFDELMVGAKSGDTREADVTISSESENIEMRGESLHIVFNVSDVKRQKLPTLDRELLQRIGVETEEELQQEIRSMLERQLTHEQRQSARSQVLDKITESADWELPEELVLRQTDNALRREVLEMQQAGFTPSQIRARENEIRQRAVSTTRQALKEHFVLDRIATQEDIQVSSTDIDVEIQMMAMQSGESPRRVRARLIKSGMIENLEAQIRERMAVDFILEKAEFVDVESDQADDADRICSIPIGICITDTQVPAETGESDEEE